MLRTVAIPEEHFTFSVAAADIEIYAVVAWFVVLVVL